MDIWMQAAVGLLIGLVPGLLLFEWLASPFSPGLWKLATPFTRVFLTVSQFLRGNGVMVKRASGEYEIGTYVPEEDGGPAIQLTDRRMSVNLEDIQWGLFGKKSFGLTWEEGTPLHERVSETQTPGEAATDGGSNSLKINMAAVHRYLRGANESDAISRTEEDAKAKHGGGPTGIDDRYMAVLIMVMVILGAATTYFSLG